MGEQNKKSFVLDSKSLKIKEVLNQDFLAIEIYAISEGETRNPCGFTLDSMEKAIPTFYNKFILGYFNVTNNSAQEGEFEEHNSDIRYDQDLDEFYWSYTDPSAEKALGLIRESDSVEIVEYKGKKWIKLTAVILTKYNREAVKHLLKSRSKRKVSVEVTVVKSHMEGDIEWIDEFILDGITILGNRRNSIVPCEEGIEGASLRVLEFLKTDVFSKQRAALSFAYKELDIENDAHEHNEKNEEVTMEENTEDNTEEVKDKDKEVITLTYEQKRQLLEAYLNQKLIVDDEENCDAYVWVADIDEENVFYFFRSSYYRTAYKIVEKEGEEETEVFVDIEQAERVLRGWENFSEEKVEAEGSEKEEQEEVNEQTFAVSEGCADCDEKAEELKEEIEEKKEELEKEIADKDKEEMCNFSAESVAEETSEIEVAKEATEEIDKVAEESATYICADGEELTGGELVEKVEKLQHELEDCKTECQNFKNECEELKKAIKDAENAKIFAEGKDYIFNEEELNADEDAEILNCLVECFETMCNDSKFENFEEAKEYLDVELAKATYKKRKQEKKEEKTFSKTFSAPIVEEQVRLGNVESNSFDEMKKLLKI